MKVYCYAQEDFKEFCIYRHKDWRTCQDFRTARDFTLEERQFIIQLCKAQKTRFLDADGVYLYELKL